MAGIPFPSVAYQNVAPFGSQIVQTQAALTALGSTWSTTPTAAPTVIAPTDPGFTDTDIRLQQLLIEQRITNQLIAQANPGLDDPQTLRADVVLTDVALTS
jgi:hypothetical protein